MKTLYELRTEKGVRPEEAAVRMKVAQGTVYQWERSPHLVREALDRADAIREYLSFLGADESEVDFATPGRVERAVKSGTGGGG